MAELALDDVERDALAGELERLGVAQLVPRNRRVTSVVYGVASLGRGSQLAALHRDHLGRLR